VIPKMAILVMRFCEKVLPLPERDGEARADLGAGGFQALFASVGAQVALHRVMSLGVIAHRAVGTRHDAFPAARAKRLVNFDHAGIGVFRDRLGMNGTGPEAGGALAVLAGEREEIGRARGGVPQPDHLVAVLAGSQPVLLLAGRLAALAAEAPLQIDHQGQLAQDSLLEDARIITSSGATSISPRRRRHNRRKR